MSEQDNTGSFVKDTELAEAGAHYENRMREDENLKGVEDTLREIEESSSFLQKLFSSETKEEIQQAKEVVEMVRGNIRYHVENHLRMFESMDSPENRDTIDRLDSFFLFDGSSISSFDEKLEVREYASSIIEELKTWKEYKHNSSSSFRDIKLYDIGGEKPYAPSEYHFNHKEIYSILQILNASGSPEERRLRFWPGDRHYKSPAENKTYEEARAMEKKGEGKKGLWQADHTYVDRHTGIQTILHYSRGPGKYGLRKLELRAVKPVMEY